MEVGWCSQVREARSASEAGADDDAGRFGQATRALRLSTRQPSHVKVNADLDYGWHDFLETDLASAKHSHLHVAYLSGKPRYDTCCSSTLHSPYMNTVSQWPAC